MKRLKQEKILRIWSLIVLWRGRSKYRKSLPALVVSNEIHKRKPKTCYKIAEYDSEQNVVTVWWRKHEHYEELTSSLLHEYTHYLQFWPWYSRYSNIHGYSKNPYELEAMASEAETKRLLNSVNDRNWRSLKRTYPRLNSIYKKVSSAILIHP